MSGQNNPINVTLIGFTNPEQNNLEKLFTHTQTRDRRYSMSSAQDIQNSQILLLCANTQEARVQASKLLKQAPQITVVITAHQQPKQSKYPFIPYPLRASSILDTLDNLKINLDTLQRAEMVQYRALVVDDSAAMRKALEIEISRIPQSVQIDMAENGEQALQLCSENVYDLIFLDIVMPGIDGFEVCKEMRKTIKKVPIIMLTGKTSPLDEVKGIMAGCSTYLTKPVDRKEFQNVLKRVVNWLDQYQAK